MRQKMREMHDKLVKDIASLNAKRDELKSQNGNSTDTRKIK